MKNVGCVVAFIGLVVASSASYAADRTGFFVNGQVGQSSLDDETLDDNDTSFAVGGSYRWGMLGIEGGYVDLGEYENVYSVPDLTTTTSADINGWTLGVNGHFNMTDNWYVSARLGIFHWDGSLDIRREYGFSPLESRVHFDESGSDWYAGIGVGYDFNSNFGLGLSYDRYKADSNGFDFTNDVVSLNAEYRF